MQNSTDDETKEAPEVIGVVKHTESVARSTDTAAIVTLGSVSPLRASRQGLLTKLEVLLAENKVENQEESSVYGVERAKSNKHVIRMSFSHESFHCDTRCCLCKD